MLVTFQHAASLTDHDRWTTVASVNAGQLGVAIFLGISALLGATSKRPPVNWFAQRLRRLYPAYWAAMILSFAIVWIVGYKEFGPGQFFAQMLGIGLFTHPNNLINVPTWFISMLLLCYAGLFAAKISRRPLLVTIGLSAIGAYWSLRHQSWPWMHTITFFGTSVIALAVPKVKLIQTFLLGGAITLLLLPLSAVFAYTALTFLLLGAVTPIVVVQPWISRVAAISYEYYLLHGVFLAGTTKTLPRHPAIAIVLGIGLAAIGAIVLQALVRQLLAQLQPKAISAA